MKHYKKLLDFASVNAPGGGAPDGGRINFSISPQNKFSPPIAISRLSIDFHNPIRLERDVALSFSLRYSGSTPPRYDILAGDIGIPEIHFILEDGTYFSFKRGNLKDFYKLSTPKKSQNITLPIESFTRNTFISTGHQNQVDLFDLGVSKICFDFLRSEDAVINAEVSDLQFVPRKRPLPPTTDYVHIVHAVESPELPISLSFRPELSMQITPKEHVSSESQMTLVVKSEDTGQNETFKLKSGPNYHRIALPKFGANRFRIELTSHGKKISSNEFIVTRSRYVQPSTGGSKLGISDEAKFNNFAKLGGEFSRKVCNLGNLLAENGHALNSLIVELQNSTKKWILAFKGMPKSMAKDLPYSHRYGPRDMNDYRKRIDTLIARLSACDVFAIEAWNEANVIHEWRDDYFVLCEMQQALWDAVKSHSPSTKVLSPSSTSWDFKYFEKLSEAGVLNYCDALALHGYTYNPASFVELYDQLENLLSEIDFHKPALITEIGFRTPAYSGDDQALFLCLFTLEAFTRKNIDAIVWFRYENPRPENITSYNQNMSAGYSMFGYGGLYSRPMVSSYILLDRLLSRCFKSSVNQHGGTRIYTFDLGNSNAYAVYNESNLATETVIRHLTPKNSIYDIFGNKIPHKNIESHRLAYILPDLLF